MRDIERESPVCIIRNLVYFTIDKIKGGKIKCSLADIKRINHAGEHTEELTAILKYVHENIFYFRFIIRVHFKSNGKFKQIINQYKG